MKRLYVLFDAECGVCRQAKHWLAVQPAFVPLVFLPLQSADSVFPGIRHLHPEEQLLTVSDAGDIWSGASAWIMVLWALQETREWAQRLSTPALRPFARIVCETVSQNRHLISKWFAQDGAQELVRKLARQEEIAERRRHEMCLREAARAERSRGEEVIAPPALPRGDGRW